MPDMGTFLDAIDSFLQDCEFDPDQSVVGQIETGHDIRRVVSEVRQSPCSMHGECKMVGVRALLDHMKKIDAWTEVNARSALDAAGFDPDAVLWQ